MTNSLLKQISCTIYSFWSNAQTNCLDDVIEKNIFWLIGITPMFL